MYNERTGEEIATAGQITALLTLTFKDPCYNSAVSFVYGEESMSVANDRIKGDAKPILTPIALLGGPAAPVDSESAIAYCTIVQTRTGHASRSRYICADRRRCQ
jgi:hypothetical protein